MNQREVCNINFGFVASIGLQLTTGSNQPINQLINYVQQGNAEKRCSLSAHMISLDSMFQQEEEDERKELS